MTNYRGHATDIVAYDFRADRYCPACIISVLTSTEEYDGWATAPSLKPIPVEDDLSEIAHAFSIDRFSEETFDSGEFPKVVFRSSDDLGFCGNYDCGREIGE